MVCPVPYLTLAVSQCHTLIRRASSCAIVALTLCTTNKSIRVPYQVIVQSKGSCDNQSGTHYRPLSFWVYFEFGLNNVWQWIQRNTAMKQTTTMCRKGIESEIMRAKATCSMSPRVRKSELQTSTACAQPVVYLGSFPRRGSLPVSVNTKTYSKLMFQPVFLSRGVIFRRHQ